MRLTRECVKCHELKPYHAFSRDSRIEGGLSVKCRECERVDREKWEQHTREKRLH